MAKRGSNLEKFKFKKGTSGNPKGRPKKFVSAVLEEIKKNGESITKSILQEIYTTMMALNEADLKEIVHHKELPMMYRIIAKELLSKKGFDIIEKMLDRAHGKPTVIQEVSGKLDTSVNIELPLPSEEIMKKYKKAKDYTEDEH